MSSSDEAKKRPNLLIFQPDQLRYDALGCNGVFTNVSNLAAIPCYAMLIRAVPCIARQPSDQNAKH